jgi:MYXO-CTERM domain-containing protein
MTDPPFFSDLSNTNCSGPIVTILAGVQFLDDSLKAVSGASVTGISLTLGDSTVTLPVDIFSTSVAVTFGPNLFTSSSVTVNPGDLNLAFRLDLPPAQYSYSLITSGLADGSIVVWNDVEAAAQTSEPGTWLLAMAGIAAIWARRRAARSGGGAAVTAWNRRIFQQWDISGLR